MNKNDLISAMGNIDRKYCDDAIDFMSNERSKRKNKVISFRKPLRTAFVAAVLMCALFTVAFAANVFGLRSMLMGSNGTSADSKNLSLAGFIGSAEYEASSEWTAWSEAYIASKGTDLAWVDHNWYPADRAYSNISKFYKVYNDEMLEKLIEISSKYSIKLHTDMNEFIPSKTLPGIIDETCLSTAVSYYYEDGSFLIDTDYHGELVQILRNDAGTLPAASLQILDPDSNKEWMYTNHFGNELDIMQLENAHRSKIMYTDGTSFILVNAFVGTKQEIEEIADSINFEALCKAKISKEQQPDLQYAAGDSYAAILNNYHDAIMNAIGIQELADIGLNPMIGYCENAPAEIGYRIADIDSNGKDELFIYNLTDDDFYGGMIYCFYTIDENGMPNLLYKSDESAGYYYSEQNRFYSRIEIDGVGTVWSLLEFVDGQMNFVSSASEKRTLSSLGGSAFSGYSN